MFLYKLSLSQICLYFQSHTLSENLHKLLWKFWQSWYNPNIVCFLKEKLLPLPSLLLIYLPKTLKKQLELNLTFWLCTARQYNIINQCEVHINNFCNPYSNNYHQKPWKLVCIPQKGKKRVTSSTHHKDQTPTALQMPEQKWPKWAKTKLSISQAFLLY